MTTTDNRSRAVLNALRNEIRAKWRGAVGWLAVIGLVGLAAAELRAREADIQRLIDARTVEISTIEAWATRYAELQAAIDAIPEPALSASAQAADPDGPSAPLWTHLEARARDAIGERRVIAITPTDHGRNGVELRLQPAGLQPLVDLLYALEEGHRPLRIRRLTIARSISGSTVDIPTSSGLIVNLEVTDASAP